MTLEKKGGKEQKQNRMTREEGNLAMIDSRVPTTLLCTSLKHMLKERHRQHIDM